MSIGVKICGVTTEAAIEACIEAGVDWVGFVFFERSPRHLSVAQAAGLVRRLPANVRPVGLFVRPVAASIAHVLADLPLAALQIYDAPSRIAAIRAAFSPEVWEARPLAPDEAPPDTTPAHRLVIEARAPDGIDRPGGTGTSLDWSGLRHWTAPAPWLLAGGLTPWKRRRRGRGEREPGNPPHRHETRQAFLDKAVQQIADAKGQRDVHQERRVRRAAIERDAGQPVEGEREDERMSTERVEGRRDQDEREVAGAMLEKAPARHAVPDEQHDGQGAGEEIVDRAIGPVVAGGGRGARTPVIEDLVERAKHIGRQQRQEVDRVERTLERHAVGDPRPIGAAQKL